MKDLIIKNINDIEAECIQRPTNTFSVKPVIAGEDIDTCAIAVVEVPVGQYAFGYHYHDQSEEVFFILKGEGTLRCADGEKAVKAGDMLCFPNGERGAHVLANASDTEALVFIDYDVRASKTDIVTLPDAGKVTVIGEHFNGTFDLPK